MGEYRVLKEFDGISEGVISVVAKEVKLYVTCKRCSHGMIALLDFEEFTEKSGPQSCCGELLGIKLKKADDDQELGHLSLTGHFDLQKWEITDDDVEWIISLEDDSHTVIKSSWNADSKKKKRVTSHERKVRMEKLDKEMEKEGLDKVTRKRRMDELLRSMLNLKGEVDGLVEDKDQDACVSQEKEVKTSNIVEIVGLKIRLIRM